MSETLSRAEQIDKIGELIAGVRISTLTTVDADGSPWTRPMAVQTDGFDGTLTYFTKSDSAKVGRVAANPNVAVAFSNPDDETYVMMAGTASVANDRARIAELWSEPMRTWFPDGPDDPELRLLTVDVSRAEFWDTPSSAVVYALGYAKAVLTGKPATPGEHGVVEL